MKNKKKLIIIIGCCIAFLIMFFALPIVKVEIPTGDLVCNYDNAPEGGFKDDSESIQWVIENCYEGPNPTEKITIFRFLLRELEIYI